MTTGYRSNPFAASACSPVAFESDTWQEIMSDTATHHFITEIIDADLAAGKNQGRVATRFPPEPNGYLHIGHAKSICLNFGLAKRYQGTCNLRFDDTNPAKEDEEYVRSIKEDIQWLGFEWTELRHASDYFQQMYDFAVMLIKQGKAYVESLSAEEMRAFRGTLTEAGKPSPYRERSVDENLAMFERMRSGEFEDGAHVLRAKIDMASGNINLRDPALYRIRKVPHQQTGDAWCIYPMYDYAHCISDAIERITHSICTLEFEDHRPLYDWILDQLPVPAHPQQIEFARLNIDYTVMSKRKLNELVVQGLVDGWDDPRMPTIAGLRRRGIPPAAIREFAEKLGVTKSNSIVEVGFLESCIRAELDAHAERRMAVLQPIKLSLRNYPEQQEEWLELANHPQKPELGSRKVPLSRELYIEADDFMEQPPKGYHRLVPGGEVRLRGAFIVRCVEVLKNADGSIAEVICEFDPDTRSGMPQSGRKVKGTIHWVSARHSVSAEVRLYDRLFNVPDPDREGDYRTHLNPKSREVLTRAQLEHSLGSAMAESVFQFERLGYFVADRHDHRAEHAVFNRSITLRDSWGKPS
jgi:glutaminyl-tRNA synthetase